MKKVRSNPIIPFFQKHNICIKALINNDIISILRIDNRPLLSVAKIQYLFDLIQTILNMRLIIEFFFDHNCKAIRIYQQ